MKIAKVIYAILVSTILSSHALAEEFPFKSILFLKDLVVNSYSYNTYYVNGVVQTHRPSIERSFCALVAKKSGRARTFYAGNRKYFVSGFWDAPVAFGGGQSFLFRINSISKDALMIRYIQCVERDVSGFSAERVSDLVNMHLLARLM